MTDPTHIYLVIWLTLIIGLTVGNYADRRLWAFVPWAIITAGGGTFTLVIMIRYILIGMGVINE